MADTKWAKNYHRLRQRLGEDIGVTCLPIGQPEPYVCVGTNFWDFIDHDQWPQVEEIVRECGEKLHNVLKNQRLSTIKDGE